MATILPLSLTTLIRRLIWADMQARLPGSGPVVVDKLTEAEICRALCLASLLALSIEYQERALAYEIATRCVSLFDEPKPVIIKGVELVLARLGNFPGRDLLLRRYKAYATEVRGANLLRFEATMRRLENTIEDAGGAPKVVTDFQYEALVSRQTSSYHNVHVVVIGS